MIAADVLGQLKAFGISARDRRLLYTSLVVNGLVILALIGAIVALIVEGKDALLLKDIVANLVWAEFALVVVFVAGNIERTRQAAKAIKEEV